MKADVMALLSALGVTVSDASAPLVDLSISSVTERILNTTNQPTIPAGLRQAAVEMAAGEYLRAVKDSGQLAGIEGSDIKSVQEGDTTVTYQATQGQRLDALISRLTDGHEPDLLRYRRLVW